MIQKSTIVAVVDKCGIFSGNVFHIYKGFKRRFGFVGDFSKSSIRGVSTENASLKGQKFNSILVRAKKINQKIDGSTFTTKQNSVVSLKKRLTPRGKEIVGPCSTKIRRKKFILSFSGAY
jgi:ribosomal protein L14